MTQEDKELLLKDLCARLPYGIKFLRESWNYEWDQELSVIEVLEDIDKDGYINRTKVYNVGDIKPYLFPLSSMTEEEFTKLKEYSGLKYNQLDLASFQNDTYKCLDFYLSEVPSYVVIKVFDWLNRYHFDYRGLITMGLAIDATGLNIYNQLLIYTDYD